MRPHTFVALLLAFAAVEVQAGEGADCAQLWKRVGPIREVKTPVWRIPVMPEEGVVRGFWVRRLYLRDGRKFVPQTSHESNCALDRMLDSKVRAALREGAAAYVSAPREADPEDRLEQLSPPIDARLNDLFVSGGMAANTGFLHIRIIMEDNFEIRRWDTDNVGALQREAFATGIYSPNLVLSWLMIAYIEHLGVRGFDGDELVGILRSSDAYLAPPNTTAVDGCPEGIEYRWLTAARPMETHADVEEGDVHWGVCRSRGEFWAYHFQNGWKKAQPSEKAGVCEDFGGQEPFRVLCAPEQR